jgi:hypothetical protein
MSVWTSPLCKIGLAAKNQMNRNHTKELGDQNPGNNTSRFFAEDEAASLKLNPKN